MNKKILLYVALMVLGLYVMPTTVSLFSGQHTFYSGMDVSCEKCHSDVLSQIVNSGYVYDRHKAAAGNTNYTTYLSLGGTDYSNDQITDYNGNIWLWTGSVWQYGSNTTNVTLDRDGLNGIDGGEICMLCHNASLFGSSAHTGVIVRVCDDDRCHGNKNNYNNSPAILGSSPNITAAGYNLSQAAIHNSFYLSASNQSSQYVASTIFGQPGNVNGSTSFISRGHWTCEGCHTQTVINLTIIQAPAYNHSETAAARRRYN
jgi:hypothetical protein